MHAGWRNSSGWGVPMVSDGMFVRNPMYDDPTGRFWQARRRASLTAPPKKPNNTKEQAEPEAPSDKPKPGSVRDIDNYIGRFSTEVTSAHGFSHIYTSKSLIGRLIWTLIVLIGIGAFGYQMIQIVSSFLKFGTVTELKIINNPQLEFPAITVCNTNKLRRSSIERSPHRQVLFIDDLRPLPHYIPCQDDDLPCDNGYLCVRSYLKCDGINHCGDNTDEKNCTYGKCGNGQIKCNKGSDKGYCIDEDKKCDGIKQCYDGQDEWDCTCRSTEYKCERRGGCIRRSLVCNGAVDCVDESDEAGCGNTETCDAGFLCTSNYPPKCTPAKFVCDGINDCDDKEDEGNPPGNFNSPVCDKKPTATPEECTSDEFDCGDGKCIPNYYKCDGVPDCDNRRDETTNCGRIRCEDYEFACGNGWQCIEASYVCDFEADCVEDVPGDEKNCTCAAVSDAEVALYSVNCQKGNIQLVEVENVIDDIDDTYIKCRGPNSEESYYAHYYEFNCNGTVTCADTENVMTQTCTSVFTECYVTSNGADYKGRVAETSDGTPCISWKSPVTSAPSPLTSPLMSTDYPLIGAHNFCRNPGGQRSSPWCYTSESRSGPDPNYGDCTIPTVAQGTCHKDVELNVRLTDTRVEIQRGDIWGTVQDTAWTLKDAKVICRMLNLGAPSMFDSSGQSADASVPVWISFIDCQGAERTLLDCVFTLKESSSSYDHTNDVGVQCSPAARKKREVGNVKDLFRRAESTAGQSLERKEIENLVNTITAEEFIVVENKHDINLQETLRQKREANGGPIGDVTEKILRQKRETDGEVTENPSYFSGDIELGGEDLDDEVDIGKGIFICESGYELPLWQACNNVPDCPNGDDESYCTSTLCNLGERPCRFEDKCIKSELECDGVPDCELKLDESFCDITSCPDQYFLCPGRPICIPIYYRCDTVNDCGNSQDELNCTFDRSTDVDMPEDPFAVYDWYERYLDIYDDPSVFEDFTEWYRPNQFNRVKGEDPVDWKSFFTFSQSADYIDLLEVLHLTKDEIKEYGHQFEDFIIDCMYDETECSRENFTLFETDDYGNCYSFNYNPTGQKVYATKTGPTYGLRMTLNVQQDEYISLTGREAGVRVVVTPRDVRPLPGENGVTIPPGVATSIGLRYENISRLGGLYGDCNQEDTVFKTFKDGMIVDSIVGEAYDSQVCLKACLHDTIQSYCGCSDTILLAGQRCLVTNVTQDTCKQLMYYLHHADLLGCDCTQQCQTRTYSQTASNAKWPSNVYRPHLLRYIHSTRPESTSDINDRLSMDDNLVRLEVFYEQLNFATTSESPAYTPYSLISDTGGTAGLYVGFSIITFMEFAVLLYQLFSRVFFPWRHREPKPDEPLQEPEPPEPPKFSKSFDWDY